MISIEQRRDLFREILAKPGLVSDFGVLVNAEDDEIVEAVKWMIDNGHDRKLGVCIEFSSDYKNITTKLSFELELREIIFNREDNEKRDHQKNLSNRGRK